MRRIALPLSVGLVVAGCYTPERASREALVVPAPESWVARAAEAESVQGDWWLRFQSQDLNAVVEDTLQNNPDLRAAEARLAAAASLARIAGADRYPNLDLEFAAARQRQNFVGLPIPGSGGVLSRTFNNFGVGLSTSWELDIWGRIRAGHKAALEDVLSSAESLRAVRQSLAAQAAKAWFAAVEARQQLDLAQRTVASFKGTESQVRDRFERGVRPALDLRLARVNVAAAEANQHLWEQQLAQATRQLEILQGRYPDGRSKIVHEMPSLPGPVPVGLPAEMLQRRPDLLALEHRLVANGFRVDEAKAALYPRISLTSGIGTTSDELSDLLDSDFYVWNVIGNVLQPVFEGGRLIAGVDLAAAEEYEALSDYAGAVLRAYSEVETVLATEGHLADRVKSLGKAATEARAAERLSEERYRMGLEDFITVSESQRSALEAQSRQLTALRQQLDQRVDLHLALGGGFEAQGGEGGG
jgi:NodT family efflux transporter outer membrane factor (OMF) lipoprotein